MGNLGGYQILTTVAKHVGGPEMFVGILFGGGILLGAGVMAGCGAVKKKVSKDLARKKREAEAAIVYTVHTEGQSNEGLLFKVGDEFKVLETDGDAGLIEKLGDDNNPYFVSLRFLEDISDYVSA